MEDYPQQLHKSGCIPWYKFPDGQVRVFLMKPSDPAFGGDRFQIAKGVIDSLESPIISAFREAEEELGCPQDNFHWEHGVEKLTDDPFHIFLGEVKNPDKMVPFHYETGEVKWLSIVELAVHARDVHLPAILKAFNRINEIVGSREEKLLEESL